MNESSSLPLFAVCAPGLEPFCASELTAMGIINVQIQPGGVEFEGNLETIYRANLHLRTASRILLRMGSFYAAGFPELIRKTARLSWNEYLLPGVPVGLRVTCHQSKLYHSGAVAERVALGISEQLGTKVSAGKVDEEAEEVPPQIVVVRFDQDQCQISLDTSGMLLHRRGYRQAVAKAPLRETLAAGMLLASGWDQHSPLLDPFCGSGTIPIEAALMAAHIAPGKNRDFAFMKWKGFDLGFWVQVLRTAQEQEIACPALIQASDRDAGAIESAQANAERAGVLSSIAFSVRAVSVVEPPRQTGWVVTNPPYGIRVSSQKDIRNLYARFGNVLREHCPGWGVSVLCNDDRLLSQMGVRFDKGVSLVNGGLPVKLGRAKIPLTPKVNQETNHSTSGDQPEG